MNNLESLYKYSSGKELSEQLPESSPSLYSFFIVFFTVSVVHPWCTKEARVPSITQLYLVKGKKSENFKISHEGFLLTF